MSPRAAKAFEDFTGRKPARSYAAKLPDRNVSGWEMGPMVGVAYEATRDGKTKQYFHEFKKTARPKLVAQDDGRKLYIAGGRYKVTDRGIEDMPQLFVVNPSPRSGGRKRKASPMRRRRATSRRRRRTSQVAIFRANPARRRRRVTTRRRRRSYARNPVATMRRNPRRRRSVATRRRRYARNPSGRGLAGGIMKLAIPAAGIGAGALGSEILMSYLPIPAQWKSGVARHLTKGAVGVAAGLVLGKVLRMKRLGNYFALGAIAIATHDALKEWLAGSMPNVRLGMYGPPIRGAVGSLRGMGYTNPALTSRLGAFTPPIHGAVGALDGIKMTHAGGETDFRA
jgi:hypothetical protein